ncbi:MAG: helix-turn-helix domain-containing protein [Desulfuromonadaceae bacterium]|nr:helix-turn-helix domain-containing protein [Desulfuromonadaceae bacterium]
MAAEKAGNEQKYELRLVVETFLMLEKVLSARGGISLTEICQCTKITKNKAFRILATLVQCGILEKDERNNYSIGITSIENACRILGKEEPLDKVKTCMERLSKATNEAVYFAKKSGSKVVFVDFVDCHQSIRATSFVGTSLRLPVSVRFPRYTTASTIGNITVDTESLSSEITTVSLPYVNKLGAVIGALVVLAPTYRMSLYRIKTEIVPALRDITQRQMTLLHDSAEPRFVPLFSHSGRELVQYPQFAMGMFSDSADAERLLA